MLHHLLLKELYRSPLPPHLILSFVALLTHLFVVVFEGVGPLRQDPHLFGGGVLVCVGLVELVVVELDIARQVRAATLIHAKFFE